MILAFRSCGLGNARPFSDAWALLNLQPSENLLMAAAFFGRLRFDFQNATSNNLTA